MIFPGHELQSVPGTQVKQSGIGGCHMLRKACNRMDECLRFVARFLDGEKTVGVLCHPAILYLMNLALTE